MEEESGSLRLIFGPMFSGKSSKLNHILTTWADTGHKVLYINHALDQRDTESQDEYLSTHSSAFKQLSNKIDAIKTDKLSNINIDNYLFIGIDEGQFFDDIDVVVRDWVLNKNKHIIIASLDGNSDMEIFGKVNNLICICEAEHIEKLHAWCAICLPKRTKASFTIKINNNNNNNNNIDVGGSDKYKAACMKCYKNHR